MVPQSISRGRSRRRAREHDEIAPNTRRRVLVLAAGGSGMEASVEEQPGRRLAASMRSSSHGSAWRPAALL